MALPLLFIGAVAGAGLVEAGRAGVGYYTATDINSTSNKKLEKNKEKANAARKDCKNALEELGREKLYVINYSISSFLDSFERIKNVNFNEIEDLNQLGEKKKTKLNLTEMRDMKNLALDIGKGLFVGGSSGALVAFASYKLATTFAIASTGTAISSLSGAAATNATLAFFGGGSLATGGGGIALGTTVLGGIVAAPAILAMGIAADVSSQKALEEAKKNKLEVEKACKQLEAWTKECQLIRRKTYCYYSILARLDADFTRMIHEMDCVINNEGYDYNLYSDDSKKKIASTVALASSIKAVLDTQILTEDGKITNELNSLVDSYLK